MDANQSNTSAVDAAEANAVAEQLKAEMESRRGKICDAIGEIRALSEREILACGQVLSTIVTDARSIIDEADKQVRESGAVAEQLTREFIEKFRAVADEQAQAVTQMSDSAQSIEGAVDYVDSLRYTSEMLATNALIEAAHLGEQGRAFGEIALQLREQSRLVKTTTGDVKNAVDEVRGGLNGVVERSDSMRGQTNDYIEEMNEFLTGDSKNGTQGGKSLDRVIELSNRALSHLQFQDPLVQKLDAIEREVRTMQERLDLILANNGDVQALEPEAVEEQSGSGPTSGDIMLF